MRLHHWMYIFLLLLPAIVRMLDKLYSNTGGVVSRYGPLLFMLLLTIGFAGHVLKRPWLARKFWRVSFWLGAGLSAILGAYGAVMLLFSSAVVPAGWMLLGAGLTVPALIALYRYSSEYNAIWPANKQ